MKKISALSMILLFFLNACDVWGVQPQPFPVGSAFPSQTPGIVTATPIILTLPFTQTPNVILLTPVLPTITETATFPLTPTVTPTSTPVQSISVDILGCNTSLDITHGMGEVTNAYVTVKNTGTADLPNTCALLRAIDEDRVHPDKTKCVVNLPVQSEVTLKLTVDSAYKQDTAIQVDASSNQILLLRTDKPSCTDISLFGGEPSDLGVIKPYQP
jgi:hypothetical protein